MKTKSLMVVEDEPSTRTALESVLRSEGYEVTSAPNGRQALSQLHDGPLPSVILLDLAMPEMNGWEFRKRQMCDPALASVPVILLSAEPDLSTDASRLHVAGYLQKPIDVDELVTLIEHSS